MYLFVAIGLMVVFPVVSIIVHLIVVPGADPLLLVGQWFTFWGIGLRLLLAGCSQTLRPVFTAREIFGIKEERAADIVRELGFANFAFGLIGLLSMPFPQFLMPAAIAGGLFLGLDGVLHVLHGKRNRNETIAMATDLIVAVAVIVYLVGALT